MHVLIRIISRSAALESRVRRAAKYSVQAKGGKCSPRAWRARVYGRRTNRQDTISGSIPGWHQFTVMPAQGYRTAHQSRQVRQRAAQQPTNNPRAMSSCRRLRRHGRFSCLSCHDYARPVIAGLAVYGSKRIAKSELQLAVSGLAVDLSKSTTIWVIVHAAQIRVINKVESFSAELQ